MVASHPKDQDFFVKPSYQPRMSQCYPGSYLSKGRKVTITSGNHGVQKCMRNIQEIHLQNKMLMCRRHLKRVYFSFCLKTDMGYQWQVALTKKISSATYQNSENEVVET